ncbi:protein ZBED8 [Octopus bimaculoides]|uniref:protein ZBED8 n=1 Tax=Octopus bimaculoides TaxID=37653 RepID=UPI00071C8ADD|nr:protein ZBED8 [Octopus bimaculoides]|eukprot:XP_014771681.1 PREDICTED: protein ZBED8-like [Octopus bimaculoides]
MSAKKQKYLDEYVRFRFVSLQKSPQCVICYKTAKNDRIRHSRLERHSRTTHLALGDYPKAFFEAKRYSLKQAKLDGSGAFRQQISMAVVAFYEITMLIAKGKKSHNIVESLIKPSLLRAAEFVPGKYSANKLSQISLSNDTVNGRIDDLSQDIKDQILDQIRDSPVFAIQCDETTDILCSQILVYPRFVSGNCVKEEMFCHPMDSGTTAAAIFRVVSNFFQENRLSWDLMVGVGTDGAPSILGLKSGFIIREKEQKNPSVACTHCILHHEVLASRTLHTEMRNILSMVIKVVNFVKAGALNSRLFKLLCKDVESEHEAMLFHTNVRWLSKGNMLGRLYELREEVAIFLDLQQKADLHGKFQSEGFQLSLAYLVDIFEVLNAFNLKLQGENITILTPHNTTQTFVAKLVLWKCRIQQGNTASFSYLDSALIHSNLLS